MSYAIIGTGNVGQTLASFFAENGVEVSLANRRGAGSIAALAKELGPNVIVTSLADALQADIIFFAVQFLDFKNVGALLPDWTGKIVVDVTNSAFLPQEVQDRELRGRLSSEVNADKVPGAKLVKAFNQLPMDTLAAPTPEGGRRVVFVASDHADASATVAALSETLGFAAIEVGKIGEGGRLIQARNALVFQNLLKYD